MVDYMSVQYQNWLAAERARRKQARKTGEVGVYDPFLGTAPFHSESLSSEPEEQDEPEIMHEEPLSYRDAGGVG